MKFLILSTIFTLLLFSVYSCGFKTDPKPPQKSVETVTIVSAPRA